MMKKTTLSALLGMVWLCAAAVSAQPEQPAATTQPTPAAPTAQPAPATQPEQPAATTQPTPAAPTAQPAPATQPEQPAEPTAQPAPAAQPAPPPQPPRPPKQVLYGDPCRSELENFCTGNQPLAIRMRCLDSHEAEFSKACQKRRAELRELRASCKAVIDQYCRYVPLFADALLTCLQDHEAELLDPCKGLREKALKPSRYIAEACQSDVKKFCKDLPMNGFRIAQCLQEHEAELTKPCLAGTEK